MSDDEYESIQVAVPRGQRYARIVFALLFCIFGLAAVVGGLFGKSGDNIPLAIIGTAVLIIGLVALARFRATHETKLTERGKAAKEAAIQAREAAIGAAVWPVVIAGAAIYFAPAVFDALSDEVRIYPLQCADWDFTKSKCAAHAWKAQAVRLFAIHSSQQIVIESHPDDDLPPTRYYNCAVAGRFDWACTVSPDTDSARVTMTHGVFKDQREYELGTRYVSRWNWWQIKME